MAGFLLRGVVAALGLWAATSMLDGIAIDSGLTLLLAGLLLGVVNAIVRPFVLLLSLPALLLSLGLFLLVINAAMLGLVALMLPGFTIPGGFWSAVGAAVIVSIVSWIGSWFIGSRGRVEVLRAPRD
ncbi:MAG TPA: phage holin family protein [Steroidobacteraceae bacterium]|nr:phage holin family protein [Steroidobacteraceae bacterium]